MIVNKELILRVAKNARLNLSEKEIETFEKDFRDVLDCFNTLNEVDVSKVDVTLHPLNLKNVVRKDEIKDSLILDDVFKNSKNKNNFFVGPKAL